MQQIKPSKRMFCETCGSEMFRRRFTGGRLEDRTGFLSRKFCSKACIKKEEESSGELVKRFFKKVQKTDYCWIWKASKDGHGYGRFSQFGRPTGSHRVAWGIYYGNIPERMNVLHRCDNPPCVRPDHLFLGTKNENSKDMVQKERHEFGERSHNAKISESEAVQIKARHKLGGETFSDLSREFGIGRKEVSRIVRGERWGHLSL